jgi:hypothetical protein
MAKPWNEHTVPHDHFNAERRAVHITDRNVLRYDPTARPRVPSRRYLKDLSEARPTAAAANPTTDRRIVA